MKSTIIVAAGRGLRMQSDIPKQFLELDGKPVLMSTIEAFHSYDPDMQLIVVLSPDHLGFWIELCQVHNFSIHHELVPGGAFRFESVKFGLEVTPENGLVAIHDGVRPFIRKETIERAFNEAAKHGNAIPAITPPESIRIETEEGNHIVNRDTVRLIQTPQVFDISTLKAAYNIPYNEKFTDDASVYEAAGHKIHLIEGQKDNIKITTPEDLK